MKTYYFVQSENEMNGIYDENKNLIISWQNGDDFSRILQNFLAHSGIRLNCFDIPSTQGEDMPAKLV